MIDKLNLDDIIFVDFPESQYYKEVFEKKQLVIHHTVSGDGVNGDVNWWKFTPERIATALIIARNGKIYQCFSSKYWAHHLGVKSQIFKNNYLPNTNLELNKESVGIELDSWGALERFDGKFYPAMFDKNSNSFVANTKAKPIDESNVYYFYNPYRGFTWYEKYTQEQLKSLGELLVFLSDKYDIDRKYNHGMWDLSIDALKGENGIWSHTSFNPNKSDAAPQLDLVNLLDKVSIS